MTALLRKAQAGRQDHAARAMSVPKALRLATAKAADDLFDMAMAMISIKQDLHSPETLPDALPKDALLVFLDGPEGQVGAAAMDPVLVGTLIQQQTMGRIAAEPPPARAMTATDAALCAPLLDGVFDRAAAMLEDAADIALLRRYRFGARADGARLLCMALEAPQYAMLRMTLDIDGGAHQGQVTVILPRPKPTPAEAPQGAVTQENCRTLDQAVRGLPADLPVILCKVPMPASQLGALAVGDQIALPPGVFPDAVVVGPAGDGLARGVLGQVDGLRVLRINTATAPAAADSGGSTAMDDLLELSAEPPPDPVMAADPLDDLSDLPDLSDLGPTPAPLDLDLSAGDQDADPPGLDLPDISDLPDLPKIEI